MKLNVYFHSQKNLANNQQENANEKVTTISRQMTEIKHQKKLDINTMTMYTKNVPRELNCRKPSSKRNNEHLWENNMTKTISNK